MFVTSHLRRGLIRMAIALAAVVLAFGGAAIPPLAAAEPNSGNWDLDEYKYCLKQTAKDLDGLDPLDIPAQVEENQKYCCYRSGGEWSGGKCVAPASNSVGTRQIPGDIETATVEPQAPPRGGAPRIPGDMPAVTQEPACPPDSSDPACSPPVP
jgi:hypothetical protein